ncbi:MAG: TlyA family RNA methyltransferase [Proteobacteria bacterium]|nr:TlyA family RNA methyltransferase [Pseudomonadota bacterium]
MPAAGFERADLLLVKRGLVETRTRAQALILAGRVYSGQGRVDKPGTRLRPDADLTVREPLPFVSRGGLKLDAALVGFGIDPAGASCLDVGASTGGFTDCLLKRGARKVYAVDVGYGQLDWGLRNDPRVLVLERVNFRTISPEALPGDLDLAVVDVSFISLRQILPNLGFFLKEGARAVVLVKPQFEAGKGKVGKGGIVRDPALREEVLGQVLEAARENGFEVLGTMESPLKGASGNVEFLASLRLVRGRRP